MRRRNGLSLPKFYKLKVKYGDVDVSEANRLKAQLDETVKIKGLLSDPVLDNVVLKRELGNN